MNCIRSFEEGLNMAGSKKASEASKVMKDPKTSPEDKSKAASEMGKAKGGTSKKK